MNERKEYKLSTSHVNRNMIVRFPVRITAIQGQARGAGRERVGRSEDAQLVLYISCHSCVCHSLAAMRSLQLFHTPPTCCCSMWPWSAHCR